LAGGGADLSRDLEAPCPGVTRTSADADVEQS
jgi:hypothetical protein